MLSYTAGHRPRPSSDDPAIAYYYLRAAGGIALCRLSALAD